MATRSGMICSAAIASLIALSGCNNSVAGSPVYLGVNISPRPASIPAGTSIVFTGTVSNNLSIPNWSVLDASNANDPGTLTPVTGSPNSIRYTAPATPPIYTGSPTGITQGAVTLDVSVADPAGTSIPLTSDAITFVITAPTVTVKLAPVTASVPLAGTQQFFGYAVGSLNNALTWSLSANGLPGGSGNLGTINTAGTYVAPLNMPISGNTVTLTVTSQADPARTASATITLH